jgi:hypothetical protein
MQDPLRLHKLVSGVKKALQTYLHVRGVAEGTPDHFDTSSTREQYIEYVKNAPVTDLKSAWVRPEYLEYLRDLPEDTWKVHLKDVLYNRDRARRIRVTKEKLQLQRKSGPVQPSSGDLQVPDGQSDRGGSERAGDGED